MTSPSRPRAVLDSDIIYSRVLHELLGRIAVELGLLDLVWGDDLLNEAARVLVENKGLSAKAAARWVGYLPQSFPDGRTDISDALASVDLALLSTDTGDRHVCALALASKAQYLFTHDRGYLKAPLRSHGVEVTAPDAYLCDVVQDSPEAVLALLSRQAQGWAGGQAVETLLDAITRAGAPRFARLVKDLL